MQMTDRFKFILMIEKGDEENKKSAKSQTTSGFRLGSNDARATSFGYILVATVASAGLGSGVLARFEAARTHNCWLIVIIEAIASLAGFHSCFFLGLISLQK